MTRKRAQSTGGLSPREKSTKFHQIQFGLPSPLPFIFVLRVASSFAAALAASTVGLVLVLSCSPVVPGSECNQVSSLTFHRTYIMPEKLLAVNLLFENKV
jgi:hypothetical protein